MELNGYELRYRMYDGDMIDVEVDARTKAEAIKYGAKNEGIDLAHVESVAFDDGSEWCVVRGCFVPLEMLAGL